MENNQEQVDYTDLPLEKVVYKRKHLSQFNKFKIQIKQNINPIILDQEEDQNMKKIESWQINIENPEDEL